MISTRVGYAGGTSADPTYENIGDHSEAIEVEYDPATIRFADLLEVFWQAHDPRYRAISRQYRSFVFWHDDEQRRQAFASRDRVVDAAGPVTTEIVAAGRFYPAEDYHQKYRLRGVAELRSDFARMYPDPVALVASTAAARVNGYLGGNGSPAQLADEIDSFGLSPAGRGALVRFVATMHPGESCALPAPSRR